MTLAKQPQNGCRDVFVAEPNRKTQLGVQRPVVPGSDKVCRVRSSILTGKVLPSYNEMILHLLSYNETVVLQIDMARSDKVS